MNPHFFTAPFLCMSAAKGGNLRFAFFFEHEFGAIQLMVVVLAILFSQNVLKSFMSFC